MTMLRPLISEKVRSTARRSAPWKSRLTGWPVNLRLGAPGCEAGTVAGWEAEPVAGCDDVTVAGWASAGGRTAAGSLACTAGAAGGIVAPRIDRGSAAGVP